MDFQVPPVSPATFCPITDFHPLERLENFRMNPTELVSRSNQNSSRSTQNAAEQSHHPVYDHKTIALGTSLTEPIPNIRPFFLGTTLKKKIDFSDKMLD